MSEREQPARRADREGIHIDRNVADAVAIETDLDSNVVRPYQIPSPRRRRTAAWVYLGAGALSLAMIESGWVVAAGLTLLALWHLLSAWPLAVDEGRAVTVAGAAAGFPVGHASATVRFRGWRLRPRWAVVLYSAADPPDQRALILVDAITGEVAEDPYVENIEPAADS